MKNRKNWLITLACAILVLAFTTGGVAADEPKEIKLGILLPLTGTFGAVAETQRDGALLAVDDLNAKGGLNMPWGKVKVEAVVGDDEAKLDVGVRRFRYMTSEGIKGIMGQTWAPMAFAINELVKKSPMPYFPTCVMAKDAFKKGTLSDATFAVAFSPWSVGYMDASAAINVLGKKRIFMLARADAWGWDIRDGVKDAIKEFGGEMVGYAELPKGTSDYTAVLQQVKAAKPDVFICAQFAGDAVALLKQCYQLGLNKDMVIFNSFITNVVAKGIPPKALKDVYSMHYYYYDLAGLKDPEVEAKAKAYTARYKKKYGTPPDAYATIAYVAANELFRGMEKAGSLDPKKIAAAVMADGGKFESVKGTAQWREDHTPIYKYAAFLVRGKGPDEQKNEWDLFEVVGYQGGPKVLPSLESLGY